ncbi:hypothetical protein LJR234_000329 [Mesorhizobium amorphae]|uniref:hypothetical protein n=1 Tax=Mesorhizobium amorphae TaxID=71433 RepID=UPI003ED16E67
MDTLWIENLKRIVDLIDQKFPRPSEIGAPPGFEAEWDNSAKFRMKVSEQRRDNRRTAEAKMVEYFKAEEDAQFSNASTDYLVRMAGIRSTSTSSWTGALTNWKTAALAKIAADDGFNPHGSGPVPIEAREV